MCGWAINRTPDFKVCYFLPCLQAKEELENLVSRINADCVILSKKRDFLTVDIENITSSRSEVCEMLEDRGTQEMIKAKEKWKQKEKGRLSALAHKKTVDLKKEAAKALEPELRKIVGDHQTNISRQREEAEHELERFKTRIEGKTDKELESQKHDIDQEHEQVLEEIRRDFRQKSRELTTNYANIIKETTERCKDDIHTIHKSFECITRKKKMEQDREILEIQDENNREILYAERCEDDEVKETQLSIYEETKRVKQQLKS